MAELDPMDVTVHQMVLDELAAFGGQATAVVRQVWSEPAGMWFTEVEPANVSAAKLSVAYQDDTTLNVSIGNIWFEMFGKVERNLGPLREMLAATFAGQLEEAGSTSNAFGRIFTPSGTQGVGAMHLPWPWRFRTVRRYSPYSGDRQQPR